MMKSKVSNIVILLILLAQLGCAQKTEDTAAKNNASMEVQSSATEKTSPAFPYVDLNLYNTKISASSELDYDTNNHLSYRAENIFDQIAQNAWCTSNNTELPSITLELEEKTDIGRVGILPGYARNEQSFFENSRPKTMEVWYNDLPEAVDELHFEDTFKMHFFDLNETGIQKITFKITEVYPGSKYQDLCIAEVDFSTKNWEDDGNTTTAETTLESWLDDKSDPYYWMQCEDGGNYNLDASGWDLLEPKELSSYGEHYMERDFNFWIPYEYKEKFNVFFLEEMNAIAFAEGIDSGCANVPFGDFTGTSITVLKPDDLEWALDYFEESSMPKKPVELNGIQANLYTDQGFGGSSIASYFFEWNGKHYRADTSYNDKNNYNPKPFLEKVIGSFNGTNKTSN